MTPSGPVYDYSVGATSPAFTDTVTVDGKAHDLSGATVRFRMRLLNSQVLAVDGLATPSGTPTDGNVTYGWQPGDLDDAGEYAFWWHVVNGTAIFDTPEGRINVGQHAPGDVTTFGAIGIRTRRQVPSIWRTLGDSENYGLPALTQTIEFVKVRELTNPLNIADEASLHPYVQEFLAKCVALELYVPAIDHWSDTRVSVKTERESAEYPDRLENLKELHAQLTAEVAAMRPRVLEILGPDSVSPPRARSMPKVNTTGPLLSPDPAKFYSRNF